MRWTASLFCLSLFFPCLTVEVARAGHGVRIASRDSPESAMVAAIAEELVRTALDVPIRKPPLLDSNAAREVLRDGELDVYPESMAALAEEILHDPDGGDIDRLRSALAKDQLRVSNPMGDFVLVYRADLPDIAPASALMLVQMPKLVGAAELRGMVARSREMGVAESAIAADFLQEKLQSLPARRSAAKPLFLGAVLLATLLGILSIRWCRLRLSARHQTATPAPAGLQCACTCPGPPCR